MACQSYVLACHPYVTRMCSYVAVGGFIMSHIGSIAVMLLHDLEAKRSLFHTIYVLQ